jgi:short-subunit dehydrogenase
MRLQLKPLAQQRIVITGATSGIGLATARMAVGRGAKLVVAARSESAVRELCDEIQSAGGEIAQVVADVGVEADVTRIARTAIERFGGFDTWINNAGVSIYGDMLDVPIADQRHLFETNFWGVVYGSLEAARHLRKRDDEFAGAIINIGSTLSDRAIPLQGMYCASKHAVKGFTDAFRMELEEDRAPIAVTLVKPGAINTPFPQNAKNFMEEKPTLPAPIYEPNVAAATILHCAEHPVRDVFIGAGGKFTSALGQYAPRLTDYYMEHAMFAAQQSGEVRDDHGDNLYEAGNCNLRQRGEHQGRVRASSVYTTASLHPWMTTTLLASAGLAALALLGRRW